MYDQENVVSRSVISFVWNPIVVGCIFICHTYTCILLLVVMPYNIFLANVPGMVATQWIYKRPIHFLSTAHQASETDITIYSAQ